MLQEVQVTPSSFSKGSRPSRLRRHPILRAMLQETSLRAQDLIWPVFVRHGKKERRAIASMPGQFQLSIDELLQEAKEAAALGIRALLIFGIPEKKDPLGSEGFSPDGIVARAVRVLKKEVPELILIADLCCCEYTDHGHCGVLRQHTWGVDLDHEATLPLLAKQAICLAQAGVDVVAPSGMVEGMVGAIREALDLSGSIDIPIMSYAVKYASSLYGPFREAAEGAPKCGDRKAYQMNPANGKEAWLESSLDVLQGADLLMVKPAGNYLDVVYRVKQAFPHYPLAAYQVSGEYAMIKAASLAGWLDEKSVVHEILLGIKRAGADLIITYFAKEIAPFLCEK